MGFLDITKIHSSLSLLWCGLEHYRFVIRKSKDPDPKEKYFTDPQHLFKSNLLQAASQPNLNQIERLDMTWHQVSGIFN